MQPVNVLFFFFIIINLFFSETDSKLDSTPEYERSILLGLKQHWGNPRSLPRWNSKSFPCNNIEWPYISCINGSVTEIYLDRTNINGSFPSAILCLLNNLTTISLRENNLSGTIPAIGLSNCSKLESLYLSSNRLTGEIPNEMFSLRSLRFLDLNTNAFSGQIPTTSELFSNKTWRGLDLCNNHLSGQIPIEDVFEHFGSNFCFDEINVCSKMKTEGKPAVAAACSKTSKSKTDKHIISIIIVAFCGAIALVLIVLAISLAVIRPWKENEKKWSMTSFQTTLGFNEAEILDGLTSENLIGKGGSGEVYRVTTGQGQTVAVKRIKLERRQQNHTLEKQFLAEVRILGGIKHDNVVNMLCCITGKNTKLLVYEYLDKQCLWKWLHDTEKKKCCRLLDFEPRLKIAIGAAQGLCYMHHVCDSPIIHRDIKPSNILVDDDFNAKIADFGLAKLLANQGDPEIASAVVGTFGYIAPEYGNTRKVNFKSDVYSFGVVLLELVTGREADIRGEYMNLAQWAHKHHNEGNSIVDALAEEINDPSYTEAAITVFKLGLACTSTSPSSRPSMIDVLKVLQRCS